MGKKIDLFVLIVFALITLVVALDYFIHARIGMGDIGHLQDLGVIEGSAKHYHHIKSVCSLLDRVWEGGGAVYFESPEYPKIAQKYLSQPNNPFPYSQMPAVTIPLDTEIGYKSFSYGTFGACNIYSLGESRYVIQYGDMASAPSM